MDDEDRINGYNLRRGTKRLIRELTIIDKDPIPGIDLHANEDNILEWHFVIHGKEDTPYYGGMYHGKLIFPSNFPFSPPKILFLTPNGRFKTNERICFSLSDFHPEEWKPAFSVTTVLQGIRDFMHDSTETIGSIETSESVKRQLAKSSSTYNGKDFTFCHLFPQLCQRKEVDSENRSSEPTNLSFIQVQPTEEVVRPLKEISAGVEPSSPRLQNVFQNPSTISPMCPKLKDIETKPQKMENIRLEERSTYNLDKEKEKASPKEIIPLQIPLTQTEIFTDDEAALPNIPIDDDTCVLCPGEKDGEHLLRQRSRRNKKWMYFIIIFIIAFISLLLLLLFPVLIFTLTRINYTN